MLRSNEIRCLRKIQRQNPKGTEPSTLADHTEGDREAFAVLKQSGLIRGWTSKDGIDACLTENGREYLKELSLSSKVRNWLRSKLHASLEAATIDLTKTAILLFFAGVAGWALG